MCGILGFLHPGKPLAAPIVEACSRTLHHRGPDDHGFWSDPDQGISLAQTRLAILDTSSAGHQPMTSASGRFVVTFNGEIYNHLEIRQSLEAASGESATLMPAWRGHSDTETLLEAVERWGVETALSRMSGMFAFCLWDRESATLYIARDRAGEKPLYYGHVGGVFAVASELRALRVLPGFDASIDRDALDLMMRFRAVPAPHSIFKSISSLLPGHFLAITQEQARRGELPTPVAYWSADGIARRLADQRRMFASDQEAIDALEQCLGAAVRRQLISDVPLGAFLSGGVDSSLVVSLMQAHARSAGGDAVRTFSIGFDQSDYNEAHHAKRVAAHLGTNHSELYVTKAECLDLVPKIAGVYDEPFSDSSQIGVYLVSRMASESVTVALTGDGGDEIFGGYNRYVNGASWWRRSARIPAPLKSLLSHALGRIPPDRADRVAAAISRRLPATMQLRRPGHRLEKLGEMLGASDIRQLYNGLVENWRASEVVLGAATIPTSIDERWPDFGTMEEQMMLMDFSFILPNALLTKVDRASMSQSLETRAPFLDPEVMEFAWSLPIGSKIRDGQGKWLVRQLLYRYVPESLVERPKMGFDVPVGQWIKGPLRPWAEALLDPVRVRQEGLFDVDRLQACWREHLAGTRDHTDRLWSVLMFQSWQDANQPPITSAGLPSVSAVAAVSP